MAALAHMSNPCVTEALGSSGKGGGQEAHSPEAWEIHHGCSWWHLGARGEAADQPSRNGGNIEQCAGKWKPVLIQSTQLTAVWLFCPLCPKGSQAGQAPAASGWCGEWSMLQREARPAAGRLVASLLCAALQLSGKPNWEKLKQSWQRGIQWGSPGRKQPALLALTLAPSSS